ncbi:hypothetical protein GGI13_000184 [Coemansia sp. RSA 455]|nr:hypothetical protein LPJ71_009624 [Coemansia sp. S17]KAJ2013267.1 hypothetical protein GGI14_005469 [Coemansia sp. S680]KAJ2056451.1 hypothetical protein GGI08_003864 [Coemansia sp. S2]KAJ2098701.1 hypothetical protein GGI09_003171 [Coemansia sp. S100]KAJ2259123.1 hypothetical protein GGI13_000184 [Coemansia sp. RSA 455]KAJ2417214.1 hypothetical protein GGF41_005411 [Coemansia sp. RSA 2531]
MPTKTDQYKVHVASKDEFKQALRIRVRVFVDIQKFPLNEEVDELDKTATHLVIIDTHRDVASQVIGTLRILKSPEAAKFGRVVILPEYQGQGIGKLLMQGAEAYVAESPEYKKYAYTKLGSQWDKQGFYVSCGYEAKGDIYDDTGCPHIWMYKPIVRNHLCHVGNVNGGEKPL